MRRLRRILFVAISAASLVGACSRRYDPNSYVLGPSAVTSIISLTSSSSSVPADGVSRIVLTAKIDPQSTKRDVQFSTTDGTFTVGAQSDAKKAIVTADASGLAVTELRSSTTVGTVTVDVVIQVDTTRSFKQSLALTFATPTADTIFSLQSAATSVPADGVSRTRITATLQLSGTSAAQRSVTFRTSTGTLIAPDQTPGKSVTVAADANGVALAELQSSQTVETAFVQATAVGFTREIAVAFVGVNVTDLITLSASAASAPADGATLTSMRATVSPALVGKGRTVDFTTSLGSFAQTTPVPIEASNVALVDLKSATTAGTARIRATVNGATADATVVFTPALPDSILLTTQDVRLKASVSASVDVTATLLRAIGTVTDKSVVSYSATDSNGSAIGLFGNVTLSTAGVSTARFSVGGTDYRGRVTLKATVAGSSATGTAVIEIIDP